MLNCFILLHQYCLKVTNHDTGRSFKPFILLVILFTILNVSFTPFSYAINKQPSLPSISEVNNAIERISSNDKLSDTQKLQATELLKVVLEQIETITSLRDQTKLYQNTLSIAPSKKADLNLQIKEFEVKSLPQDLDNASLVKLDALLNEEKIFLKEKRNRMSDIDAEINAEKSLNLPLMLEKARDSLDLAKAEFNSLDPNKSGDNAEYILASSTVHLKQAKIDMLEQRLLSRNPRLKLLDTEKALLSKQVSASESRLLMLQNLITGHRQNEAERILAFNIKTLDTLTNNDQGVTTILAKNVALARELKQLIADHDTSLNHLDNVSQIANRYEQKYLSLIEQLKILRLESSPAFGEALRKQRDNLADLEGTKKQLDEYQKKLTESRIAQFNIDTELEPESLLALYNRLMESDANIKPSPRLEKAFKDYQDLLKKLSLGYSIYINDLSKLLTNLNTLNERSKEYVELLNQQLLWMPSTDPITLKTLIDSAILLFSLSKNISWVNIIDLPAESNKQILFITISSFIFLFLILFKRRKFVNLLSEMKDKVDDVNHDRMKLTFIASLITIILALPKAFFMLAISGLIYSIGNSYLATTLIYTALIYLVLEFLSQCLRKDGLAAIHFKWDPQTQNLLKKNMSWFKWLFIPLITVTLLSEHQANTQIHGTIGRICFVSAALVSAIFIYRALGLKKTLNTSSNSLSNTNYQVKLFVALTLFLIPLSLSSLSLLGYHYTASQLAIYFSKSIVVAMVAIFFYFIARRSFSISEKRLALEKARAEHDALLAKNQNNEAENISLTNELATINLQSVSKQTDILIKMVVTIAAGLLFWNIWAEIFSAFQRLDTVYLWGTQALDGSNPDAKLFSLWDMLLIITTVAITFVSARNIPGLVEIIFLSRMSLDVGTNYAITTISRYLIVITGSIIALQLLGAEWSKLQWLVAALSVGLGFGLQEIVANFVSGIMILFERPIRIGDTVTIGDQFGTVSKIRIRATTIVDWDRKEVIIPNKTFITERLVNWTLTDPIIRTIIDVGVAYGTDDTLVENCLLKVAKANKKVLETPPPVALFRRFGDNSLEFQLRVFLNGISDLNPVIHELHKAINHEFLENHIEISFPQRDIHFDPKPIEVRLINAKQNDSQTE